MRPIVMCGIPRSGSTLVWQILRDVFPRQEILKTHPDVWEPDGSMAVVSIRDPHDVVASLYRVRLNRGRQEEGTEEDLESVLRRTQSSFEALKRIREGPSTWLWYEDFYQDYTPIYSRISAVFNVRISLFLRTQLDARYSLEANQKRAAKLKDFNDVDADEIHGGHIGSVHPGYWRRELPEWALDRVRRVCEPIAGRWGYESQY